MVTIQDVAREAGVSAMTVSNVINNRPHVKGSTRAKVVAAMTTLDYRINVAARNLRAGRTSTIGLAVAEVDRPYWSQLAARVIAEAAGHGLQVAIEQTGASRQSELEALSMSRNRMYDGLILSTVGLGSSDIDKLRVDYPVVILGERIFDGPVDHVAMANVDGSETATRHLIERGSTRIAILDNHASGELDVSTLRHEGYRRALEAAGLPVVPELSRKIEQLTMESGRAATVALIDSGVAFDGLFCLTDSVAIGALRGLADRGLTSPGDVRVIGFDGVEEGAYTVPSLSTVDPDHALMAKTAVDLLVDRIDNPDSGRPPVEFVSTFKVIERESSGQANRRT